MANIKFIISMLIFGTIGLFVKNLPFPSALTAMCRGFIGSGFLMLVLSMKKQKLNTPSIKKNLILLILSGGAIGFNWIFLFEAYKYTTIANATLCYYMAPVFVILLSPLLFKEKLTKAKIISTICAVIGMVFVSGVLTNSGNVGVKGVLFGLTAAILYASAMILNKFFKDISSYETTVFQLLTAAVIVLPYVVITTDFSSISVGINNIAMLIVVGIIHTGVAYYLYFSAIPKMKSQSIAFLSYIDPISAIILSAIFLSEPMGIFEIAGAVLILGSTAANTLYEHIKK